MTMQRYGTAEESFLNRSEPLAWSDCIVWTGGVNSRGYGRLRVDGIQSSAHRYAWERTHGRIPDGMQVDHVCHTRSCVNLDHLRLATNIENSQNRAGAYSNSSTGVRGVSRRGSGYAARIHVGGTQYHLGTFPTVEEAARTVAAKRQADFGSFAGNN